MFLMPGYLEEKIESMPVLSKFYGIVIRMAFIRAFTAHFHAMYGQWELIVGIAPLRVRDMVLEWAAQHQRELMDDWNRCSVAVPPLPIRPLQ